PGDKLVAFNGAPIRSFLGFASTLSERIKDQPFTLTWRTTSGEEKTAQLQQARSTEKNELGLPSGQLYLGIAPRIAGPEESLTPELVRLRLSPAKAFIRSVQIVPQVTAKIA